MKSANNWVFRHCVVREEKITYITSQLTEEKLESYGFTQLLKWTPKGWGHTDIFWNVIAMDYTEIPSAKLVCVGPNGEVFVATENKQTEDFIDFEEEGPVGRGSIRDVRFIGSYVYVVGMGRQIYKKKNNDLGNSNVEWKRFDSEIVLPVAHSQVCGFNSVTGRSESEVYCVGWGGEIYWYNGSRWKSVSSPTNLKLEHIFYGNNNRYFVLGQSGVILYGRYDKWKIVDSAGETEQFWGGCALSDRVFVATVNKIYEVLSDNSLKELSVSDAPFSTGYLASKDNVVWSVGTEDIFFLDRNKKWTKVFLTE